MHAVQMHAVYILGKTPSKPFIYGPSNYHRSKSEGLYITTVHFDIVSYPAAGMWLHKTHHSTHMHTSIVNLQTQ